MLESENACVVSERLVDLIQPLEQRLTMMTGKIEGDGLQAGRADRAAMKVHAKRVTLFGCRRKHLDVRRAHADRQQAVLNAVCIKDIAETLRDHAANAELFQRPDRHFSRTTAPEIAAAEEDLGATER